jgi:hypothetical protein
LFYDPKGQDIDYLLREALEDTIQTISLPEPLYEDESEDESILYTVDLTPKSSTSNIEQTTTPKSNDLAERPTKDIEQLPTPSRTVSPDLLEINTIPGGLQDDILDIIEEIPTQLSLPKPSNRKTNTAPRANEVSAEPSADVVLPEGLKRIRRQAHATVLANLSTLFGYYAGFAIGLVKDIDRTRSLSSSLYRDNLPPELKNLKELRKHLLTTGF